jgi:hypothetical protein
MTLANDLGSAFSYAKIKRNSQIALKQPASGSIDARKMRPLFIIAGKTMGNKSCKSEASHTHIHQRTTPEDKTEGTCKIS